MTRRSAPLVAVLAVAAPLVLLDLGGPSFWEDEGDTAIFASRILDTGLPLAWDGRAFLDSDDGARVAPSFLGVPFVMVGTPWLPYYVVAGSFALFGASEWAARLPFALAALGAVALLYAFVMRVAGTRRAALAAALLLVLSTQFLLYARESRSYALTMLLTLVVLSGFERLGRRPRDPWLVVGAVLLFHVQILPAAIALAACGAFALLHPAGRPRLRPLLWRAPIVAATTLPWLVATWNAAGANAALLTSVSEMPARVAQLLSESAVAVPLVGWAIGLPLLWGRLRSGERELVALCAAWLISCSVLAPLLLSQELLHVVGLRYVCAMLPIAAAVTGVLVGGAARDRRAPYVAGIALFGATHLAGNALPWLALGETRDAFGVRWWAPRETHDKLFATTLVYFVRGLGAQDDGTVAKLAEFLRREAQPDDVVITNFGWDNLHYYTGLRQGLRISRSVAPAVWSAAKARGLPAFVLEPDDADWIVWRGDNEAFLGYAFTASERRLPQLTRELRARGARIELVATVPEVAWQNRPELFWHRFPGVGQPFAPRSLGAAGARYSDARVFRIHWPAAAEP